MPALVWLDVETTGLDPERDRLLEVAVALADLRDPSNVRHVFQQVMYFPPRPDKARELGWGETTLRISENAWARLDPFIVEMHTKNGLFDECPNGMQPYEVEKRLLDLIPWVEDKDDRPILAGSSIHFDHAFLKVHMPHVSARLSHRHYDVSALKLVCQSLGMPRFRKAEAHRAKDDIDESVRHGLECVEWMADRGHDLYTMRGSR